jgi:hypothetical protein
MICTTAMPTSGPIDFPCPAPIFCSRTRFAAPPGRTSRRQTRRATNTPDLATHKPRRVRSLASATLRSPGSRRGPSRAAVGVDVDLEQGVHAAHAPASRQSMLALVS